ncbi:hypothetical protein, partial [Streptomyces sp. NPDC001927]
GADAHEDLAAGAHGRRTAVGGKLRLPADWAESLAALKLGLTAQLPPDGGRVARRHAWRHDGG